MPKARAWRNSGKTAKRTSGAATGPAIGSGTLSESAMPTRERLAMAGGAFEIGGHGPRRMVRMTDAPLEQLRARALLTEAQYQTLWRLGVHHFMGFRSAHLRAVDLNRIAAPGFHSETTGERAARHREIFFVGWKALNAAECFVVLEMVLMERGITTVGAEIGYRSPYRGRQAVLEALRSAAGKITSAWLTMEREN